MVENILVMEQDIYTLSPIVFAGLVALMFTTGKWRMYPIATLYLFTLTIAFSMFMVGKIEESLYLLNIFGIFSVIYIVFIKRRGVE